MSTITIGPFKSLGAVAITGLALWGGWRLGRYLAEVALGEKDFPWDKIAEMFKEKEVDEPLWKRRFSPISGK